MTLLEDELADALDDLLTEAGEQFTYRNGDGGATTTITAIRSVQPAIQVDAGDGLIVEVRPVFFRMTQSDLPYGTPERGHRIEDGSIIYEVQPIAGGKCYHSPNESMIRIHTKRIDD